jgi:predicted N-acetyltransferase YhbS
LIAQEIAKKSLVNNPVNWLYGNGERKRKMRISVRLLRENDLAAAHQICRLAFGTFTGHPEPEKFGGDMDKIRPRWLADPNAAFCAEVDGELVASVLVAHWGSVGYFGPLTVHPDFWGMRIAQRLLEPTMDLFASWETKHNGLYTFSQSPMHLALYQKYGFWPRFLTATMTRAVKPGRLKKGITRYSEASDPERVTLLAAIKKVTDAIYPGLDVSREVNVVFHHRMGDTLLLWDGSELVGFSVCHCGPGTEAGSDTCWIKFGGVLPGPGGRELFQRLINACDEFASIQGMSTLKAGVNAGRQEAYRLMLSQGFRTLDLGVAMHRPNEPAYHHPGIFVMDDWR